jgi:phospholipid/cholesterol/gamma-HCH transport system permease protein
MGQVIRSVASLSFVEMIGKKVRHSLAFAWALVVFQIRVLKMVPATLLNFHFTVAQMYAIGVSSIPLVATTSIFTGGVTAYQMAYMFSDFVPDVYIGLAVGKSVFTELGPILTAMVMAGRIGAAMCAELGTMAVTEQLDAMSCLNLSPYRYLLAPRFLATIVMMPILTILSAAVAISGAYGVAWAVKDLPLDIYIKGIKMFYTNKDVYIALFKSFTFGYIIAIFACYFGYHTRNGSEGVGESTKSSVVYAMTCILISSFTISKLFL